MHFFINLEYVFIIRFANLFSQRRKWNWLLSPTQSYHEIEIKHTFFYLHLTMIRSYVYIPSEIDQSKQVSLIYITVFCLF